MSAVARRTDPDTSHAAAASIENLNARQAAVLACFRHSAACVGLTDDDLRRLYDSLLIGPKQTDSSLRTRRSELVRSGLVIDSGRRRQLPTGRTAIVWKAAS